MCEYDQQLFQDTQKHVDGFRSNKVLLRDAQLTCLALKTTIVRLVFLDQFGNVTNQWCAIR